MRRVAPLILSLACAACGARSGLGEVDALGPARADADVTDLVQSPRSCWSEPNCIEADVMLDGEELAYREIAAVTPTSRVLWLSGEWLGPVMINIKFFRDAKAGVQPFDPVDGNVFVTLYTRDAGCVMRGEIVLRTVDTRPGGVSEGSFGGEVSDCPNARIRNGRFRLTAP